MHKIIRTCFSEYNYKVKSRLFHSSGEAGCNGKDRFDPRTRTWLYVESSLNVHKPSLPELQKINSEVLYRCEGSNQCDVSMFKKEKNEGKMLDYDYRLL